MSLLRNLAAGLRGLFRKEQVEREMDEELRAYLDAVVNEKMRRGMSRKEAVRAARIEMGGVEGIKEQVRTVSWESFLETLWQDLRFGLRLLRFNPAFAAAAILSLALGIGANTAIFQLLDAVRLRTLPVKNPEQMVKINIDHRNGASGNFSTRYPDLTYAQWEQIRAQQQAFSSVFVWGPNLFNISPGGEVRLDPQRVRDRARDIRPVQGLRKRQQRLRETERAHGWSREGGPLVQLCRRVHGGHACLAVHCQESVALGKRFKFFGDTPSRSAFSVS